MLLLYGHECAGREIGVDHRKRAFEYVVHRLDLRRKLVASLHETTLASDTLVKTIEGKTAALATIRGRLQDAIRELSLDEPKP